MLSEGAQGVAVDTCAGAPCRSAQASEVSRIAGARAVRQTVQSERNSGVAGLVARGCSAGVEAAAVMADDLDYAHQAGARARQNGRPLSSCPTYAMGDLGNAWRKAWREGWAEKDREFTAVKGGR